MPKMPLAEFLGNPEEWERFGFFDLDTVCELWLYQCPQCGAAVKNAYMHKAWHLQAKF